MQYGGKCKQPFEITLRIIRVLFASPCLVLWRYINEGKASRFPRPLQRSCKRQPVFRSICSVPANVNQFSAAFAAFLQTPTSFPRYLQRSCKRQPVSRGLCSIPANANRFSTAFAAFLQTPTSFPRHLQRCCKRQPKFGMNIRPHCRGKTFFDRCKILGAYLVIHFCVTIIKQIMG